MSGKKKEARFCDLTSCFRVVRVKGLEPSWGCPHTDLNRTRLPIPPRPHNKGFLSKRVNMIPEFMDRDKEKLHVL